jgi:hypothetical protein
MLDLTDVNLLCFFYILQTHRTVWGKLAGLCYGDYHKTNRIAMYNTWRCRRDKIMIDLGRTSFGQACQSNAQPCRPTVSTSCEPNHGPVANHTVNTQHSMLLHNPIFCLVMLLVDAYNSVCLLLLILA